MDKKALIDREFEVQSHTRHFLGSLAASDDLGKQQRMATAIRDHWGIENKNHYKRDTCQWREDDHRHRRVNAAQNLALTRNALLALIPFDKKTTLSTCLDNYQAHPARAIKLLLHARPI